MKSIVACEQGDWTILTWNNEDGSNPRVMPFKCHSWRHAGECRDFCGACDFARVSEAIRSRQHWTYAVLTYPARQWPDVAELFRFGVIHWSRLRKRLIRRYGAIEYIQTWEVHKSGYPHVNVVISNEELYNSTVSNHFLVKKEEIDPMCHEVGFGFCRWLEPLRDNDRMAGYLVKLGLELTGHARKNQTPVNAPRHFRRLRASRGLLPKRLKNDKITGQLLRQRYDDVMRELNCPSTEKGKP